jgi:tetratricopeptide (TPR) repeat protein
MQSSTRTWTIAAVVVIVVLAAILLGMGHKSATPASVPAQMATTTATSTASLATTTASVAASSPVAVVTSSTLQGSTAQPNADQEYAMLVQGINDKNAGNYKGAATIWETVALSNTYVSFMAYADLADLYMNFIKDYPQAEIDLEAVIALKPDYIDAYRNLYSLYTVYGYKAGTSAAADILAQGLKANPGNQDLLNLQAQLNGQTH